MEMEEVYNIFDLLYDVWEPYSETHNLKLILNFLSKYTVNKPDNYRMHEARKMKRVITELKSLWSQKGPVKTVYKKDLYGCINLISTALLKSELSDDLLSKESFNEWSHDYKKYLKNTVTNNELNMPTTSKTIDYGTAFHCQNNETSSSSVPQVDFQPAIAGPSIIKNKTKTKEREKGGFNALLDSTEELFECSSNFECGVMEMEKIFDVTDLLFEVWQPYSGTHNLQLILNFLSEYTVNQSNNHRMHEARMMKHVITELKSLWSQKSPVKTVYKKDLYHFINLISTTSLKLKLSKKLLSKKSFNEWSHDYKKYLKNIFTNNNFNIPTTSKAIDHGTASHCQNNETSSSSVLQVDFQPATVGPSIMNNETETKDKEKGENDFDSFESFFKKYKEHVRILQYIKKKSENERLNILESSSETGSD